MNCHHGVAGRLVPIKQSHLPIEVITAVNLTREMDQPLLKNAKTIRTFRNK